MNFALPVSSVNRKTLGESWSQKIPYACLLALLLMIPFDSARAILTVHGQNFRNVELFVLATLLVWIACSLVSARPPLLKTGLTAPVLSLLGVMVVSTAAAAHQIEAARLIFRFLIGFLVYLLAASVLIRTSRFVGMLAAVAVTASVVSALALMEYFQVPFARHWLEPFNKGAFFLGAQFRARSTLPYPTIASMYLEISFGLTLSLLLLAKERKIRTAALLSFLALVLMAASIMVTLSRAGLLVMALMLVLAGGIWAKRRGFDSGCRALVALAVTVVGLYALIFSHQPVHWVRSELAAQEVATGGPGRLTLWRLAARMLAAHPLLGVGPDNFRLTYGNYAGWKTWDHSLYANNTYLEFFANTGLAGGLLFLWMTWRILAQLRRSWKTLAPAGVPLFVGPACATTAILSHGLVDYFLVFTSTYLMIWITFALAMAHSPPVLPSRQ